jgi:hypothetical protein
MERWAMPASGLWLIIALPGVWLTGRNLAMNLTSDRRMARLVAPALGAACWLLLVHFTGRETGSFWTGLVVGTVLTIATGILVWLIQRRHQDGPGRQVGVREDVQQGTAWLMIGSALLSAAFIAPMALGWAFHDEQLYTGHTGIISQMQNGHYPPRHMTFPELEYRYHYGFDLAAAALAAMLRVRPGTAIDLLTLASWTYSWCLLWLLGDRLLGPGRGWLTAFLTLFGGGLPFLLAIEDGYYVARFVMICMVGGTDLNPPVISYFFQHPWALGLPLGLCVILLVLDAGKPVPARYVCLGLLLAALTISHVVVFASLAGAVLVAEVFSHGPVEWKRITGISAAIAAALVAGKAGGGFFLPPPDQMGLGLSLQARVADSLWSTLVWHTLTYGLLLPLGICGLFLLREGRLLFLLLLAGSLGVLNFVTYAHSWDIVKFGTISAISLSICASATVARVLSTRPALLGTCLGVLLLTGATLDGLAFPILFAVNAPGIPLAMYPKEASNPPSEPDLQAIAWLRRRVPAGDLVYRLPAAALAYDHVGGLPVPWFDGLTDSFGFSRERMERRRQLLVSPSADADRYDSEGIRWFVFGPADSTLSGYADQWIKQGRAQVEKQFGPLRIVRLIPAAATQNMQRL